MNRAFLVGNLTRDPELRKTQSDVSVCTFTIACNRRFTNANGQREADFIPIVVWRGQADNCYRYLKKGRRVAVSGSIQVRNFDDKDGNRRYVTEVVADEVEFLSPANEGGGRNSGEYDSFAPQSPNHSGGDMQSVEDDDLPF